MKNLFAKLKDRLFYSIQGNQYNGYPWFRRVYKVFGIPVKTTKWEPAWETYSFKRIFKVESDKVTLLRELEKLLERFPVADDYYPKPEKK